MFKVNMVMNIQTIINEEVVNYLQEEDYFDITLPDDIKKFSNRYFGRGVVWYGDPDQMIYIHKDFVDGMFGNIYNHDKLQYVEDIIRHSDEYVEFECSYALGGMVTLTDIKEEQNAVANDRFETDYEGTQNPATIGDEELDNYIGNDGLDDTDLLAWVSWDDIDLYNLLEKNKFFLLHGKTVEQLKEEINQLRIKTKEEIDEDFTNADFDFIKEFIEVETNLKKAVDDGDGDIGYFRIQLRDAHHRVMGAIAAGENYICVNLEKDDLRQYGNILNNLKYVGRVTTS